jgi:hypothetical protein
MARIPFPTRGLCTICPRLVSSSRTVFPRAQAFQARWSNKGIISQRHLHDDSAGLSSAQARDKALKKNVTGKEEQRQADKTAAEQKVEDLEGEKSIRNRIPVSLDEPMMRNGERLGWDFGPEPSFH